MALERAEPLARGDFRVKAGETTELEIDLVPPNSTGLCTIRGTVRANGEPLAGARVNAYNDGEHWGEVGEDGRYEITGVPAGPIKLTVCFVQKKGNSTIMQGVRTDEITLQPGQHWTQDYDLTTYRVEVTVRGRGGESPVEDVRVKLRGLEPANRDTSILGITDGDGHASLEVTCAGTFRLEADHPDVGFASQVLSVPAGWSITLELDAGVPCAGVFSLPDDLRAPRFVGSYLRFRYEDETGRAARYLFVERDRRGGPFNIAGMRPGKYEVSFSWGDGGSLPIEFVLPPLGSTDLRFDFEGP